jgi:hypothetical protein
MATWDITGIGGNTSAIAGASGTTTIQTLSATAPGDFDGNNVTLVEIFNAGSTSDQGTNDVIALTTFDMVVNGTTMSIPQSGSALATGSTASTASGTTAQWEGAAIDIGQSYTRSGKQDNDFFTISGREHLLGRERTICTRDPCPERERANVRVLYGSACRHSGAYAAVKWDGFRF